MRESLASVSKPNNHARIALACAALAAIVSFFYGTVPHDQAPFTKWDLASYREMAGAAPGLADGISRHFAYRVLGPWIVGVLPLEDPAGFRLVTTLVLALTAAAFGRFLLRRGVSASSAIVATVGFVCNKHMFGYPAWNPFQVGDALSLLAIVLLFDALAERRWVRFGVVFLLGTIARESVLVMAPVALAAVLARTDRGRARAIGAVAASTLPGVIAYALLRGSIEASGSATFAGAFAEHVGKFRRAETWARLLVNAYAPYAAFPLIFWRQTRRFFASHPHAAAYLAMIFLSTALGSNNERLMGPASVVFFWLLAFILEKIPRAPRHALVLASLLVMLDHLYARYPLPSAGHTTVLTALGLVLATGLGVWARGKGAPGRR